MHVSAALSARMIVSRHQASLVSSTSSSYDALLACDQEPHTRHARVQLLLGLQKVTTIGEQKGPLEGNDGTSYGSTHVLNPTHAHHTAPLVDAPAEPLKPEMNARRLSASAGYSLKSRLKVRQPIRYKKKKVARTLILTGNDERADMDLGVLHQRSEACQTVGRIDPCCSYRAHGS